MKNLKDQGSVFTGFGERTYYTGLLSVICASMLFACSEQPGQNTAKNQSEVTATEYIKREVATSSLDRSNTTDSVSISQILGDGFSSNNLSSANSNSVLGTIGGFGFNGSIASIIGNVGGFGFGGFGTFASIFAGSLPTSPPAGFILPPGTGLPPGAGGGFGPPGAGFSPTPPGAGIPGTPGNPAAGNPGAGNPGAGNPGGGNPGNPATPGTPGGAASPPPFTGTLPGGGAFPPANSPVFGGGNIGNNTTTISDFNLSELSSPLSNTDLNFLFASPTAAAANSKGDINALVVTETTTPCAGGGTVTKTIDDVAPVGLSTGDSRTTTYVDCIRSVGGTTVRNGIRGFSTDEMTGMPFVSTNWSSTSTMFKDNFVRSDTVSGINRTTTGNTTTSIAVSDVSLSQSASGTGTTVITDATTTSTANHSFDLAFSWDTTTQTYAIGLDVGVDKTDVDQFGAILTTNTPLSGTIGQAPSAGQLTLNKTLNGISTSIMTATAQIDGSVLVETDVDADGIIDSTATAADWAGVLFGIFNGV